LPELLFLGEFREIHFKRNEIFHEIEDLKGMLLPVLDFMFELGDFIDSVFTKEKLIQSPLIVVDKMHSLLIQRK
jgi:hypothetical protein